MGNLGRAPGKPVLDNLAASNLRRGALRGLPSGQDVSAEMSTVKVLSKAEMKMNLPTDMAALVDTLELDQKAPLWFYILQEAEEHGGGKLTGVGGAITAAVFANLLKRDPTTYVHIPHFKPWGGFAEGGRVFTGMVNWLEANRAHTKYQKEVMCG